MKSRPSFKPNFKLSIKPSIGLLVTAFAVAVLAAAILAHGLLYWINKESVNEAAEQSAKMAAENTVRNVSNLIGLLNQSLAGQADDAKLAAILGQADPALIHAAEERLTRTIPNAWLARLLPENIEVPDESRSPHMGFADLNMIKEALTETTQPAFHLAHSPDAHLAMARRLATGGGIILVSWPLKILAATVTHEGACGIELRQESISLAYRGAPTCKDGKPAGEKAVSGTPWKIVYWIRPDVSTGTQWFVGTLGGFLVWIVGFAAALVYFLNSALRQDRKNLLALINDLQSGSFLGDYTFKLAEFAAMAKEISGVNRNRRDLAPGFLTQPLAPSVLSLPESLSGRMPASVDPVQEAQAGEGESFEDIGIHPVQKADKAASMGIFRGSDIRGLVGETLTEETVYAIGLAIGSEMDSRGEKQVVIARDSRLFQPRIDQTAGARFAGLGAQGHQYRPSAHTATLLRHLHAGCPLRRYAHRRQQPAGS